MTGLVDGTGRVDVIVAARNAEASVARAVASALAEREVASVAVVDDASTDATTAAAWAADDGSGRLNVTALPHKQGPAAARNRALAVGGAEWVAVLDADDRILPGRFGTLLTFAEGVDLVADELLVEEAERPGWRAMFDPPVAARLPLDAARFIAGNISHGARGRRDLGYLKPLVRRSLLAGGGFAEGLRLGEDYELYARLLLGGARGLLVPATGYVYTIAPGSLSGTHGIADLRALRDADDGLIRLAGTRALRALVARHRRSVDARLQWRLLIAAVGARDAGAAARCFTRSPPVSWFLARQLAEQLRVRTGRWLTRKRSTR